MGTKLGAGAGIVNYNAQKGPGEIISVCPASDFVSHFYRVITCGD